MVDTLHQKRDIIREAIKQQRKALSPLEQQKAAQALLTTCKHFLNKTSSIAGYQAMSGEISLEPIFSYCHANNITTFLPIMRKQALMFAPFDSSTTFTTKQYGIQEPDVPKSNYVSPSELELVLVPLVAFDKTCNRIGMGGGFYDRSFEFRKTQNTNPTLVGVAHALQEVNNVYAQAWDVGLDFIASGNRVIENHSL